METRVEKIVRFTSDMMVGIGVDRLDGVAIVPVVFSFDAVPGGLVSLSSIGDVPQPVSQSYVSSWLDEVSSDGVGMVFFAVMSDADDSDMQVLKLKLSESSASVLGSGAKDDDGILVGLVAIGGERRVLTMGIGSGGGIGTVAVGPSFGSSFLW